MTRRLARDMESGGHVARVLDNAAPEPYERDDPAFWMRLPENRFWAGAFAFALERAREAGARYLWFCNNDIRFVSEPPFAARVAARLKKMTVRLGREPGVYAPAVHRNPYHPQMIRRDGVAWSRVALVDGIAPIVNLDCVQTVGGLDERDNMRGYGVDVWLSLRAHRAGWPVVVDHEVVLRHDYHTTAKAVPGFMDAAALAENAYLSARIGPDWREHLMMLQRERHDEAVL